MIYLKHPRDACFCQASQVLKSETAVSGGFMNLGSAGVFSPTLLDLGPGKPPEPPFHIYFLFWH